MILLRTPAISMHSQQKYCSSLWMLLSISMILSFNFLWLLQRVVGVLSAIINLLWRVSFYFFRLSNLVSITLRFLQNSLYSLTNSVCFDVRLCCSFIAKSISWSLVIFYNCFQVRMLLPAFFILLTVSALMPPFYIISIIASFQLLPYLWIYTITMSLVQKYYF